MRLSFRNHPIRWGVGGLLVGALVLLVVLTGRLDINRRLTPSPLLGKAVPAIDLPSLDGEEAVRFDSWKGEIVVVNFFASWCLQCLEEHQDLVSVAEAFQGKGVRFVQVVYQDEPDRISAFLDREGRSASTFYARDPGSRAAIALGVFGIPETYFIDPSGVLVGKIQGQANALLLGTTIDQIMQGQEPGQQVVGETQSSPTS